MGLLICNIDIYGGQKWMLQVVAEHSDVVNKWQAC